MQLAVIVGNCRAERFLTGISVIKAPCFAQINCPDAAVILGESASPDSGDAEISSALGVIVDGETFRGKIPRGIQLIDCGLSQKSTVFITSRTEDKITLSLSRSIRTASGVCDPLELPVPLPESASDFDIMAAFAAEILLR